MLQLSCWQPYVLFVQKVRSNTCHTSHSHASTELSHLSCQFQLFALCQFALDHFNFPHSQRAKFLNISKCIWNGFFIDWTLTICWLRLVLQSVLRMWLKSEVDQRLWIRRLCHCQSVQCVFHHLMVPSEFITSSNRAGWSSNVKCPGLEVICLQKL